MGGVQRRWTCRIINGLYTYYTVVALDPKATENSKLRVCAAPAATGPFQGFHGASSMTHHELRELRVEYSSCTLSLVAGATASTPYPTSTVLFYWGMIYDTPSVAYQRVGITDYDRWKITEDKPAE